MATVTRLKDPEPALTKVGRVRALQDQAAALCEEIVADALASITELAASLEALSGLEAVKPGIRDRARQLAGSLTEEANTIKALEERR
jgi:hypothetical protein